MPIPKFILNDETISNSYGFMILTAGGKLERFKNNPVMLSDHINKNENTIGKWLNLEITNGQILADPDFDIDTELGKDIHGRVDRGYLKGASMGILPNWDSMERIGDVMVLKEWELVEASIVPVPSNRNSIAIYGMDGQIMPDDKVQELCLSIENKNNPNININKSKKMKKIILSMSALFALGFETQPEDGHEASIIEAKILGLASQVKTATTENEALKLAVQTAKDAQIAEAKTRITAKVELGITQGKFTADKKDEMVSLGLTSETALDIVLGNTAVKQNFSAGVTIPSGTGAVEVKSVDDFVKLSPAEQLAFKNDNPEGYEKLTNI